MGFKRLHAWQAAMELASLTFRTTKVLPSTEGWLKSQVNRSAMSVAANIAEGHGRGSLGDYLRFLDIATGSLSEFESHLYFLEQEALISKEDAARLEAARVKAGNLLHGLARSTAQKTKQTWDRSRSRVSDDAADYEV